MSADKIVYAVLSGHAGTVALVGTGIYPGVAPESAGTPRIVYQEITLLPVSAMGSDTGLMRSRMQVSVWGADYTQSKDVADQVRDALQRYRGTAGGIEVQACYLESSVDLYDEDARRLGVAIDFDIVFRE
jgi:hypothetical protein